MSSALRNFFRHSESIYYVMLFISIAILSLVQPFVQSDLAMALHAVSGIFFLNSTHVIFTFSLYFGVREIRSLPSLNTPRFWYGLAFILISISALMWIEKHFNPEAVKIALLSLFFTASRHHGVNQTLGLLLQENRKQTVRFELSRLDASLAWILPSFIFGCSLVAPDLYYTALGLSLAAQVKTLGAHFLRHGFHWSSASFICRYLMYVNSGSNYWFMIGTAFLHGLEYLGIYRKIAETYDVDYKNRRTTYGLLIILVPVFMYIHYSDLLRSYWPQVVSDSSLFYTLVIFGKLISFVHFYFDAHLFRFKDKSVRDLIGPTL